MPTALIIGASRGLGRALVEEHLKRGWDVICTVRTPGALDAIRNDRLNVELLDTTDWAGIDALKVKLAGRALDLLFVSAAIIGPSSGRIGDADPEAFAEMMLVNVLAPLRLADRLADLVTPKGMIAVMSSSLGSIARNTFGSWEAYRTSKAALNMGLASIAARRSDGRTYVACDPGWVRTDMGGAGATLSIEESIPNLVTALGNRAGTGGLRYIDYQDRDLPW